MGPKHARPHPPGQGQGQQRGPGGAGGQRRRKSLLIGINYLGSQHQLNGCFDDIENVGRFLSHHGYPSDPQSQIILRDDQPGPHKPTGAHILAAMDWLVSEPNTTCFLHYSGHGGQVRDTDGVTNSTGLDDTLVPVDFETKGQISSDILHEHLVTRLARGSTLFVVLDCCHSGSALELPYVYRSDSDGNVGLMDNLKTGMKLLSDANHLIQGQRKLDINSAKELYGSATSFFRGIQHMGGGGEDEGLAEDNAYADAHGEEKKRVTMFSGCQDAQTSADASIKGRATGAMSWAFMKTIRSDQTPTYLEVLQQTRKLLDESHYQQIPQLSMGTEMDLNSPLMI